MNNRRKLVVALGAGALTVPFASIAQQQGKVWRIGFLGAATASGYARQVDALREGLRELGYAEGRNLVIEYRWADENYDRLPALAAELVRLNVDAIVTYGTPGTRAAKQATTTIPIVITSVSDAVASGLIVSLAQPGGNVTGSTILSPEIHAKRLEMLKEIMPRASRVAVLSNLDNPGNGAIRRSMETAAMSLKVAIQHFEVRGTHEFDDAFSAMVKRRVDAVAVIDDAVMTANSSAIAEVALKHRLASAGNKELADAGGLVGYGVNRLDMFRRAAYFVDRILKGAKPGDLPVEQPTKFETVINLKTAKALGIKIPNSILVRATQVIE